MKLILHLKFAFALAGLALFTCQFTTSALGAGSDNSIKSSSKDSFIGGGKGNKILDNSIDSVIGGGDTNTIENESPYSFIGGGQYNTNNGEYATIGGGYDNWASGLATVAGGYGNTASGDTATVAGGEFNAAEGTVATVGGGQVNEASAWGSTVGGGSANYALGQYSTVPGGFRNIASGYGSFAAGADAEAANTNTFVWSDGTALFSSTANYQFLIQASGGVGIGEEDPAGALHITGPTNAPSGALQPEDNGLVLGTTGTSGYKWIQSYGGPLILNPTSNNVGVDNTSPQYLLVVGSSESPAYCNGTTWENGSDRNAKKDFAMVNAREVLEKVASMPITEWQYKVDASGLKHLGPMAQDFHAAFGLNGPDDKHISTVDEGGVALAAIQGLNQKVDEKDAEIADLKKENDELAQRLNELEQTVKTLAQRN